MIDLLALIFIHLISSFWSFGWAEKKNNNNNKGKLLRELIFAMQAAPFPLNWKKASALFDT